MTPPNKPEWIELAEADAAPQGKKSTRALPALVLAAALSIVGVGALVGQSGEKVPAQVTEQGLSVLASATPASPSAISQPSALKQPAIATMPTGGDDDEDDEDDRHGRGDHDEDEDDEEGDDD
jgi:hypothetical protein